MRMAPPPWRDRGERRLPGRGWSLCVRRNPIDLEVDASRGGGVCLDTGRTGRRTSRPGTGDPAPWPGRGTRGCLTTPSACRRGCRRASLVPFEAHGVPAGEVGTNRALNLAVIGTVMQGRRHVVSGIRRSAIFGEVDLGRPLISNGPEQADGGDALAPVHPEPDFDRGSRRRARHCASHVEAQRGLPPPAATPDG